MDCEDVHNVSVHFENDVCVLAPVATESSAKAAQSDAPSMSNNSSSSRLQKVSASGNQERKGTKNARSKNIPSTSSTGAKVKEADAEDRKKIHKRLNQNQFYCGSCEIVLGIKDVRSHALGKQHKAKGFSLMWHKSSVTVKGFNPDTTEDILYDYFSSFGLVTTVLISREVALFAAIEFETSCSVTHCTESYYFVHRLNGSDLTVTKGLPWTDTQNVDSNSQETCSENARQQKCITCKVGFAAGKSREHYLSKQHARKAYSRLKPSHCLSVKKFHQDTSVQAFHDYFSHVGIVTLVVIFYKKYALIEFSQKCSVRHATDYRSAPHILGDCELVVYAGMPLGGDLPDIPFHIENDSRYQYCISNKKKVAKSSVPKVVKSEPDEMKNVATCSEKELAEKANAFIEKIRRKNRKRMDTWTMCQACSAFISPDDRCNHYLGKKHTKNSIPLMKESHCVLLVNCPATLTAKNLYDYFDSEKVQTIDMRRSMEGLVVIEFENEYPLKDKFDSKKPKVSIGGTDLTLLKGRSLSVAAQDSTVSHDDEKCPEQELKTIAPCSKSQTTNSAACTLASLIENEFKNALEAHHVHKSSVKTFADNLESSSVNDSVPNEIMSKSSVPNVVINKNSTANDEIVKSSAPNDKIMKYSAAPSDEIVIESPASSSGDWIVIESSDGLSDNEIMIESSGAPSDNEIVIESSDAPSDDEIVIESSDAPSDNEIVVESSAASSDANDKKEPKRKPVPCDICGSFLAPEEVRKHNLGKKHIENAMKFLNVKNCITVTGYLKGCKAEKLHDYFSRFGKVDAVKIFKKDKGALVGFHSEKSAYSFADGNSNLEFERHQLSVKLGHPSIYGRGKPLESLPPHDDLMASLQKCKTVELQIARLQSSVLLSKQNMRARLKLCRSLEKILRQYFPRCACSLFGSSINSFGTKGSDVDILFEADFEEHFSFKDRKEEQVYKPKTKIKSPKIQDVISGRLCADDLTELPKIVQLDLIKKILRKGKNRLYAVTLVPAATCPIVKFVSSTFGLSCDVSNGDRLAVCNSLLLETFGKLDERVIPLVTTLRYWAKKYDYIAKFKFSSYAFTLMVIFFLQTREPHILPSVEYLRSCAEKKVVVADVDCSFCSDVEKMKRSTNCETTENLLFEFFKYYGQFEYSKFVISPLKGQCELLELLDLCNPSGSQVFKVGAVCIQDPFLVYRNVSSVVKEESLRCMAAHMRKISMERNFYFKKQVSQSGMWGIPQIFEVVPKDLKIPKGLLNPPNPFTMAKIILDEVIVKGVKKKYGINCTQCINLSEIVVHEVCCLVMNVLHMFLFVTEIVEDERDICEWVLKAKSFSCTCVESCITANNMHSEKLDGDLSEVSKSSDSSTLDEQLVENSLDVNGRSSASVTSQDSDESYLKTAGIGASDTPGQSSPKIPVPFDVSKHEPILSLYFTVAFQTWVCRKKYRKQCNKELSAFEIEKWVSQRIAEEKSLEVKEPAKFKCEFYDHYGYAAPVLYLKMTPPETKRCWKPLMTFLKQGLQKHVSCLLSS